MLKIMSDFTLQKKLDKNIDEFKVHQELNLKDT